MLSVKLCDVKLENPTILASGVLGVSGKLMSRVFENGVGAVTTKSISLEPREGHKNPTVLAGDDFIINAVGLSNPGVKASLKEIRYVKSKGIPIIASIVGKDVKDFGVVAKEVSKAKPDFVEVNISCPNVEDELGKPFACSVSDSSAVVKEVKANTSIPIIVKLAPNVSDIKVIAKAVEDAGADVISAINTVGPEKNEFLANKAGGVSGPKIKKIALEKVRSICSVVKIPVIGIGGISTGADAIEMLKAGAVCVGIGSGVYFRGIDVFSKVCDEIKEYMGKNNIKSVDEIKDK
jgi:dihydroorotate dehydrogenase (NAD+) catalytic subunit